jgi:hypothetical protein
VLALKHSEGAREMWETLFQPIENRPTPHAAAIHYRERAKMWRESAAAVPDGAPQQAIYLEFAEGYARLAVQYETRERLPKRVALPK